MRWFERKSIKNQLLTLLCIAEMLGLNQRDLNNSKDYLEYNEYGLCFDNLVTQMHEYNIEIDNDVYQLITDVATRMKIPIEEYGFMKELIRGDGQIPKPVKDELGKIIKSLR